MIWICGCVFCMVSLFCHLLQFCCVLQAPANDTGRESVQCYRTFVMVKELLELLPWSTALSVLSQIPLDVGTIFRCFSAPMVPYKILSCCYLMDFLSCVTGGEEAASVFMWHIGYLATQRYFHNLNVDFWVLVRLLMWPLISFQL